MVAVNRGVIFLHPLKLIAQLVLDPRKELVIPDFWLASGKACIVDEVSQLEAAHSARHVFVVRVLWREITGIALNALVHIR
ncbi:hypothetical protein D3C79_897820 [compost metagenome]